MTATDPEMREIDEEYEVLRRELEELFRVGTDRARVNDLLAQASRQLEGGDRDRARLSMAKALSVATGVTGEFIGRFIVEARNLLVSTRTMGADLGTARPMLTSASKALKGGMYRKAATLALRSVEAIGGLDDDQMETLKAVVKARYNLTLVETLGLRMEGAREPLAEALAAMKGGDHARARRLASQVRTRVRALSRERREAVRLLTKARFAVLAARGAGADVTEARELLDRGEEMVDRGELAVARELLDDAASLAEHACREGAGEDGTADPLEEHRRRAEEAVERTRRMGADVSDAQMHYATGWKRQQEGDAEGAVRYYMKAVDEAIRAGKALAWRGG